MAAICHVNRRTACQRNMVDEHMLHEAIVLFAFAEENA
jgi:hypothetical protein